MACTQTFCCIRKPMHEGFCWLINKVQLLVEVFCHNSWGVVYHWLKLKTWVTSPSFFDFREALRQTNSPLKERPERPQIPLPFQCRTWTHVEVKAGPLEVSHSLRWLTLMLKEFRVGVTINKIEKKVFQRHANYYAKSTYSTFFIVFFYYLMLKKKLLVASFSFENIPE